MGEKESSGVRRVSEPMVGVYLVFSVLFLIYLVLSHSAYYTTGLYILIVLGLLSFITFISDINKNSKKTLFFILPVMLFYTYILQSPSFITGYSYVPGYFLYPSLDGLNSSIYLSLIIIILLGLSSLSYEARKGNTLNTREKLKSFASPSVSDDYVRKLLFLVYAVFIILISLQIVNILIALNTGTQYSITDVIVEIIPALFSLMFVYLLVKTYMKDGIQYAILLLMSFVATTTYFQKATEWNGVFIYTAWMIPFALLGMFIFVGCLVEYRKERIEEKEAGAPNL